jgi:hypothetical protein
MLANEKKLTKKLYKICHCLEKKHFTDETLVHSSEGCAIKPFTVITHTYTSSLNANCPTFACMYLLFDQSLFFGACNVNQCF